MGLRKTTLFFTEEMPKNFSHDCQHAGKDMNQAPPKYKGAPPMPTCSVTQCQNPEAKKMHTQPESLYLKKCNKV
jgi:hypothetical protein